MRNKAPGGSEGCTSNEKTQAIFSLRDRLTSRLAPQWGVILILSWVGTLLYPPECSAYTRWRLSSVWWRNSWAAAAAAYACSHLSGLWGAAGPARAARYSGSVESHRLLLFLLSSSFVWLCSSCAPQRQPLRGEGERKRRKTAAAPLISAKLSGCLPLALCYASTASLTA